MSRSIKKGPYVSEALLKRIVEKIRCQQSPSWKPGRGQAPFSRISSRHTIAMHDGRKHVRYMLPRIWLAKLGEFAPTRTFRGHAGEKTSGRK